jgi:hypothetical protein
MPSALMSWLKPSPRAVCDLLGAFHAKATRTCIWNRLNLRCVIVLTDVTETSRYRNEEKGVLRLVSQLSQGPVTAIKRTRWLQLRPVNRINGCLQIPEKTLITASPDQIA